jgi:hypothetical protein
MYLFFEFQFALRIASRLLLGQISRIALIASPLRVTTASLPLNPFLFPSIHEYMACNFQASRHPLHNL